MRFAELRTMNPELEAFYNRELAGYEAARLAGDDTALEAALHYCCKYDLAVPNWLRDGLAKDGAARLLPSRKPVPIGRSNSPAARKWMNMIHFARFDTVNEVCEQQVLQARQLEFLE